MADGGHGGDCCDDCALARKMGQETPCDRAARLGQPVPCDGGACAAPTAAPYYARAGYAGIEAGPIGKPGKLPRSTACACTDIAPGADENMRRLGVTAAMAMRMGGGMIAAGRGTGAIALAPKPPIPGPHVRYTAPGGTYARALADWLRQATYETAADQLERQRIFYATLQLDGQSEQEYRDMLRDVARNARTTDQQRHWMATMSSPSVAYLPIMSARDLADMASGHADESMRALNPSLQPTTTPGGGGGSGGGGGTGSGSGSGGGSGATAADRQAVINGVVQAVSSAAGTVLALVREANAHDAQIRQQEAEQAAARIARNDSREQMLVQAVTEATGAGFDAQTAARQLAGGDRATAVATLSGAQGRLAAAVGTSAVFTGNGTLAGAISSARSAIATVARQIDASAPPSLPPVNPLNNAPPPPPPPSGGTSWGLLAAVGAGVAAIVAIFAGRK